MSKVQELLDECERECGPVARGYAVAVLLEWLNQGKPSVPEIDAAKSAADSAMIAAVEASKK